MIRSRLSFILLLCVFAIGANAQDLKQLSVLYTDGQFEKALPELDKLIAGNPSAEAYKLRGDCYQKLGELAAAKDDYDRARINGYDGDELFLNRGICKSSLGFYEEARQDLAVYLERQEKDPRGYYWMAALEYMNMDNKACLRYVDEALWLDSTYADAYYLRGANYMEQGKTNFALEDFESAYQFNTKLFRAKMNTAVILLDMGQFQNALEILTELKTESIDFIGEVLYYSGEAMYYLHDMDGACDEWREAAHQGDKDGEDNYRRLCLDKKGKPKFKRRIYGQF